MVTLKTNKPEGSPERGGKERNNSGFSSGDSIHTKRDCRSVVYICVLVVCLLGPHGVSCRPHSPGHHHHNATDGAVRLVGGQLEGTGNVLIYHRGEWGAVCDDGWNLDSAHIVCRALGHAYALGYTNQAYFGVPKHSIQLDDVRCYGDESSILDCNHDIWGVHDCDEREAAGVFCTPKTHSRLTSPRPRRRTTTTISTTTTTTSPTIPTKRSTPRKTTKSNMAANNPVPPMVKFVAPPTNRPEHVVHTLPEPRVQAFMRDGREQTVHLTERLLETNRQPEERQRGRQAEVVEVEEVVTERLTDKENQEGTEATQERQVEAGTLTPFTGAPNVALSTATPPVSTENNDVSTEELLTLFENVTDPALAEILKKKKAKIQKEIDADKAKIKAFVEETENEVDVKIYDNPHQPRPYEIRVVNGRSRMEGRVEVNIGGVWGLICSDNWGLLEARVACHQAGLGYAKMAAIGTYFGGESMPKIVSGLKCDGLEDSLSECYHEKVGDVTCAEVQFIAGVVCTFQLPDLVPNNTILETSSYLQDLPMHYLQCAMEEGCASSSAYELKKKYHDWGSQRRRLLRFTSSTWNYGTSDFNPFIPKNAWEWHMCHMHYHSMEVFAVYDLLDMNHNKIAEGHKASFCLEDVECLPGKTKRYECVGYSDQGISPGCADTYLHNIDCQWIDITDVKTGRYIFRVHINPQIKVAELDYTNNAATCDLDYNGYRVEVTNCAIGDGSHLPHRPSEE